MAGNQQTGSHEPHHYRKFDRLPQPFRRQLQNAAENYKIDWVEGLIKVHGEQTAYRKVRQQLASFQRATVLKFYGPDHPQARA